MIRTLLVTAALIALAGAVTIRVKDAPYVTYLHGDKKAATEGLIRKAKAGDGFAAYLVGTMSHDDPRRTQEWLLTAVTDGEERAASPFLLHVVRGGSCEPALSLLETFARAHDVGAAVSLGDLARDGVCGTRDLVRAAGYYEGVLRLDPTFGHRLDTLPPLAADAPVRLLPERYDVTLDTARQKFMAAAPALLAAR